jgi:SAM-dependent methyltransferase
MLDIGCSAGYVLEAARTLGLREMGVDISEFAVNLCRERGYQAELGSLINLPFPDGSFDIVSCKHTLEHVEDPLKALSEIRRVLKPRGVALVVVPDGDYFKIRLWPRYARHFHPRKRGWQHHVYFSSANLRQACRRVQLETVCTSKAVFRKRLVQGARGPYEAIRHAVLLGWTWLCRVTRTRRELFHVVRNSPAVAPAIHIEGASASLGR